MADQYRNWQGTAADLAVTAGEWLESLGFEKERERLNERQVRYYVQEEVLSPPQRQGREKLFSFRQLLELVVARELANDDWPLAKIALWNRKAKEKDLLDLVDNRTRSAPRLMDTLVGPAFPETRRLILAVNDDPQADLDVYDWLAARGAVVLRAYSTSQALTLLDRARVHIVISDLARVEGEVLNKRAGMELTQRIRDRGSDVPIVIFTMDKSPHVRDLAVDAGANYVTEDTVELLDWLEKLGI